MKAIEQPHLLRSEAFRVALGVVNGYRYGEGIDVMSEDWDNLFILDACRYDYFEQYNSIEGDLRRVTSKGKSSWGFIEHNFIGKELHDTVYVTANPFFHKIDQDVFYTIRSTLENPATGGAGMEVGIHHVHPERVMELAQKTHAEYPDKRLIVHFLQPHQPFIGEKADQIRQAIDEDALAERVPDRKGDYISHTFVEDGTISIDEFREMYTETLEYVLDYAQELHDSLPGKSVITADHGELLGERYLGKRRWGHGREYECEETREVPWHVLEADERRDTTAETPIGFETPAENSINQHLEALGYR